MQKRSQITHAALLDSALHCFARLGYDGASVASICEDAGVSKGAFYHHFQSKQALFLELLQNWLQTLDDRFAALEDAGGSAPEMLESMARQAGSILQDASGQLPMYLEFIQQAARDPVIWKHTIEPLHRYQTRFTRLLEAGMHDGTLQPAHAPTAARTLVAMAVGLLLQAVIDPQDEDWSDVMHASVSLFLNGLRGTSQETRT